MRREPKSRSAVLKISLFALVLTIAGLVAASTPAEAVGKACIRENVPTNPQFVRQNLGNWEPALKVFVEATGTTGFLSPSDDQAGTASSFQGVAPTGGASSTAWVHTGTPAPATFSVSTKQPLDRTYWLNLSKPIGGQLFWANTLAITNGAAGRESTHFKVELFVGPDRVGGQEDIYSSVTTGTGWRTVNFCFRPEIDRLAEGQDLTMKVTVYDGMLDFNVGTSEPRQSYFEIRYFTQNPLEGALYLEDAQLVTSADIGSEDSPSASSETGWWLTSAPIVAGLALASTRRGRTALIAGVLVLMALSGCFGGPSVSQTTEDSSKKGNDIGLEFEKNKTLEQNKLGALRGVIKDGDKAGKPIEGVQVSILATSHLQSTKADGSFIFENITARGYVVRLDADEFNPTQVEVTVRVGEIAWLNVTLRRPAAVSLGDKPHPHDEWPPEGVVDVWQDNFVPDWKTTQQPIYYTGGVRNGDRSACQSVDFCEARIPVAIDALILPGARLVEVTLDWAAQPLAPRALSLRVTTSANTTQDQIFVLRGPQDPFKVAIFPNEADAGHAQSSQWVFYVKLPRSAQGCLLNQNCHLTNQQPYIAGPISVKIKAFKGVVPYEPKHKNFWQGKDQVKIFSEHVISLALQETGCPQAAVATFPQALIGWKPTDDQLIPPGTQRLFGYFRYTTGTTIPATVEGQIKTDWSFLYRPASVPDWNWKGNLKTPTFTPGPGANNQTFEIQVLKEEPDQYYQHFSRWFFHLDDRIPDDQEPRLKSNCGHRYYLSMWAEKDPNWDPNAA